MMKEEINPARWIEVDLEAIAHNTAQVKGLLSPGVRLMAVVKGDGYGHGLVPAARAALARGADMLGVTHPEEGVVLREAGIAAPVLIFRPLLPGEEEIAAAYRLTVTLSDLQQAKRLAAAARKIGERIPMHVKIETGMGRTGFTPASFWSEVDELLSLPELKWEGIYTHFSAAAGDPSFTRRQFRVFREVVNTLAGRGIRIPLRHVCNSAALLLYPEMHLDLVRAGTLLYGQLPAGIRSAPLSLRGTWSFWARVVHLQRLPRGATVGYGRTYRVRRDTVLAVLPVGYSDGFGLDVAPRPAGWWDLVKVLGKTAGAFLGFPWGAYYVKVNGKSAPVVGRLGMGLCCVDVGKIPEVCIGTPVLLPARRTVISSAVPRLYVKGGEAALREPEGESPFNRHDSSGND
ncbi:MAG: alanine racemase [Firmicutes bacterium]|nr:alanine racemase [Bacillota bacterium]